MKRRLFASAAVMAAAALPWPAPQAHVLPTTRILVVGDSLSQGYAGDWTWRYWLGRELRRQGVSADFVGPTRLPYRGTRYERAVAWDSDHAAKAGSTVDDHLPLIAEEMQEYHPDVLVVELGYNDIARGDDASVVAQQLQDLITRAQVTSPTTRVVLAEVTSTQSRAYDATSADVNNRMATWALLHGVTIAHNRTGVGPGGLRWDPVRHTWDGLHPNSAGQTLLALRIADALHHAGVLVGAPADLYAVRAWSPDARPTVTVTAGGALVSWRRAAHDLCFTGVQVLVDGVARTGWRDVPSLLTQVRLRLPPGQHTFQLVVRRGRMVSRPGGSIIAAVA